MRSCGQNTGQIVVPFLTVARGAADNSQHARAVFEADGVNINRELIDQGYGRFRKDLGGAEEQAMTI